MGKYSVNPKLNAFLQSIEDDIMSIYDNPEDCINEIKRYKQSFPKEPDYNLAQYGRVLVSSWQIIQRMKQCGYKGVYGNNDTIWEKYKHQVGYVVRIILKNRQNG